MIDSRPDGGEANVPSEKSRWLAYGVLAATCALVIAVYTYTAHSGFLASTSLEAPGDYYNLLVQGFRAGQLSLKKEVPPGLAQLADPYDPSAHLPYQVLDLSYYKGKFYLYFGVTPAGVLFWPWVALTGHYLPQKDAAVIFCVVGFLASAGLLWALWRRYFAEVSVAVVAAGTLALGLATFTPLLLARCDVYEVSISCGYAMTMLALAATWKALHESERRCWWAAAASLAYGLAVGARPSLLLGAVILLVPVIQARRETRKLSGLAAAVVPIALIGLGLMFYNALRFGNPFEFGWRYQLAGDRQGTVQEFSPRYLWFNFRVYFLELARWSSRFPFVHPIAVPPVPAGHGQVDYALGILTNVPLVWLALAVPLGWRKRRAEAHSRLRGFVAALAVLFGICALTVGLFFAACIRYEVEFLPVLVLLAVIGILGLERRLTPASRTRRAVRWGWSLLLGVSVAFNLLASVGRCAESHYNLGSVLVRQGRIGEGIDQYQRALRLRPDYAAAHNNLAIVLFGQGKVNEAMAHWEQALRIDPDYADADSNLGLALTQLGNIQGAIEQYKQALRIRPDLLGAHYNLGVALARLGRDQEAVEHYEEALRIKPDYAEAHLNLGAALVHLGREQEAMGHWEQALRINPNYAEAHYNLGVALARRGRMAEAIGHWEQALRIKPDYAEAHYDLGIALEQAGQMKEAIEHYRQALRIKPGYAEARERLARLQPAR